MRALRGVNPAGTTKVPSHTTECKTFEAVLCVQYGDAPLEKAVMPSPTPTSISAASGISCNSTTTAAPAAATIPSTTTTSVTSSPGGASTVLASPAAQADNAYGNLSAGGRVSPMAASPGGAVEATGGSASVPSSDSPSTGSQMRREMVAMQVTQVSHSLWRYFNDSSSGGGGSLYLQY